MNDSNNNKANDGKLFEQIDRFHTFYSDAWAKLIHLLIGGFVIIGIIVPFGIAFWNLYSIESKAKVIKGEIFLEMTEKLKEMENRILDKQSVIESRLLNKQKAMESEQKNISETTRKDLNQKLKSAVKSINTEMKSLNEDMKLNNDLIEGEISYIRGKMVFSEGNFHEAAYYFAKAALLYCKGKEGVNRNEVNIQKALESLTSALPKTKSKYDEADKLNSMIEFLLKKLWEQNTDNRYKLAIENLEKEFKTARSEWKSMFDSALSPFDYTFPLKLN